MHIEKENSTEVFSVDDYNAFSAGVELGGLRNTVQIKNLIVYLIKRLDNQLTQANLIEIFALHGLANYFDTSQALEEVLANSNVVSDDNGVLSITPKGRVAIGELEGSIPKAVRDKALNDAITIKTLERRENENKIDVEYLENGANVTFTISNAENVLMKLTVFAADDSQIERIKKNFLKDPVSLYAGIVSTLFS